MSISIVIPTFNSSRFLAHAITSVLGQARPPDEIVVVDDGSVDDTPDVVRRFGSAVSYIHQANRGVSAARNTGLAAATGTWTLFLDADDCLTANALEALASAARGDEGDRATFGDSDVVDDRGRTTGVLQRPQLAGPPPEPARQFFNWCGHPPGNFLVPTWAARRVGGFDSRFSYAADSYFLMQVGTLVPFVHVPVRVLRYQQHTANMSHDRRLAVVDSVDSRLAFLAWTRDQGVDVIAAPPSESNLVITLALRYFYTRQWAALDAALGVADERQIRSPELARLRRLRLIPPIVFRAKDLSDRAWSSVSR